MSKPILRVENVSKAFGGVQALDQVHFEVQAGSITSLIGPNGAGKTTFFNCLTGVLPPDTGSLEIMTGSEMRSLLNLAPDQVVRLGLARTFQNIRLFNQMTVLENVVCGAYTQSDEGAISAVFPWGSVAQQREALEDFAMALLDKLHLSEFAHRWASELSYGQQRWLEIARALASKPQLLLLDEPAAGLTFQEKQALCGLLKQLQSEGLSILLIEHDMQVVMPVSDWVVVLDYGEQIAQGVPEAIQKDPKVIEAYLGVGADHV